jgi:hypothetical protein
LRKKREEKKEGKGRSRKVGMRKIKNECGVGMRKRGEKRRSGEDKEEDRRKSWDEKIIDEKERREKVGIRRKRNVKMNGKKKGYLANREVSESTFL